MLRLALHEQKQLYYTKILSVCVGPCVMEVGCLRVDTTSVTCMTFVLIDFWLWPCTAECACGVSE